MPEWPLKGPLVGVSKETTACRKVLLGWRIQIRTACPVNTGVPLVDLAAGPDA